MSPRLHILRIPAQHSVRSLLASWRWLREDPDNRRVEPDNYAALPLDLRQFRTWFRRCLDERISARSAPERPWRKLDPDWQRDAWHAARRVNTPRLIVRPHEIPAEFRARLRHRLCEDEG